MPLSALALLVVDGAMHAGWNLLVKRAQQRQIFTRLSLVAGAICFLPLLVFGATPLLPIGVADRRRGGADLAADPLYRRRARM